MMRWGKGGAVFSFDEGEGDIDEEEYDKSRG